MNNNYIDNNSVKPEEFKDAYREHGSMSRDKNIDSPMQIVSRSNANH